VTETVATLDHVRDHVSRALTGFLDRQRALVAGIADELLPVVDAAQDALAGGKRLRAAFCYWGWRGAGGPDNVEILTAAAALELLHASALVHDDVLDDSDTRRGRPTVHKVFSARHVAQGWRGSADGFGAGAAILIGDLLLVWTDEMLHTSGLPDAALRRGRPVLDLMRTELMTGQYLDVLEQVAGHGTVEGALRVVRFKTAKYTIERPLLLGAALAGPDGADGADPALAAGYAGYGMPLGVAFQLRDDILGVFGDPAQTGKPAGDDIREGKRTVLVAIARDRATAAQADAIGRLLGNPAIDPAGVAEFRDLLIETGALAESELMIDRYVSEALTALDGAPITAEAKTALAELAIASTARTH
jgi:geranylgeranyl diphosphate synthase, type I